MKFSLDELVQRELHYAIVDEVDTILIDEARTPLIISGPAEESTDKYYKIDRIIPRLKRAATIVEGKLSEIESRRPGDYIVDEKATTVALTEEGVADVRAAARRRQPLRPAQHRHRCTTSSRRCGRTRSSKRDVDYVVEGRRGHHRRRVHRPPDAGPALVGRPAPGGRGQGRRARSSARTRRSRRSRSRTTSACTRSSPA